MSEITIPIPDGIDDWGKILITSLNSVFSGVVKVIREDINKLSGEVVTFKTELLQLVNSANDKAQEALANSNKTAQIVENFREELTGIRRELTVAREVINDNRKEIATLRHENVDLKRESVRVKQQTNMQEAYSRRDNLTIRGIPEVQHDNKTTCDQLVRNFFIETMSVKKEDVDAMRFVRVHRIGKPLTQVQNKTTPPPRSIIVRFNDYSDRQRVWEWRKNLGHTKYSVNENFPQSVEYNRRKLYPIYKLAKKSEALREKVTLKNDVLTVDNEKFTVDNINKLPDQLHPKKLCYKTDANTYAFGGLYSEYCSLSNWKLVNFTYNNKQFSSSEQAYFYTMALKSKDMNSADKIITTTSPREIKQQGKLIKGFNVHSWNKIKGDVMLEILRCKFNQNADLKQDLINTGDKKLVESGRSAYYAAGLSLMDRDILDSTKYTGKNKLGEFLQTVRQELK